MNTRNLVKYGEYIALGSQIAASMIVPVVIGIYADSRWDLSPWGVIIGALLGFGSLISIVLRLAAKTGKTEYQKNHSISKEYKSESRQEGDSKI